MPEQNTSRTVYDLLKQRGEARNQLVQSSVDLERMGVTFGPRPPESYVAVATFKDGSHLELYQGVEPETTIAALEGRMDDLETVGWVSTFEGENDNADRLVHVTLDWGSGTFDFHNVAGATAFALDPTEPHTRDLVLFRRRIVHLQGGTPQSGAVLEDEVAHYTVTGIGFKMRVPRDEEKEKANIPYVPSKILLLSPLGGVEWQV